MRIVFALLVAGLLAACTTGAPKSVISEQSSANPYCLHFKAHHQVDAC